MARRKRTPEEEARRTKIRELLQASNVGSMEDIQNLFKETIAEFMETGLDAELDEELGYSKYDYRNKKTDNSRNGHNQKTLRTSCKQSSKISQNSPESIPLCGPWEGTIRHKVYQSCLC